MNDTFTSDFVKHRWAEAGKTYVPRVLAKWKKLVSFQESIMELRRKRASYRTIAEISRITNRIASVLAGK
jgi:hypothetical protein